MCRIKVSYAYIYKYMFLACIFPVLFGHKRSPLHYAAANCNYQCLFALVGSGASVNDLDERGCTPLHYAATSDTDGKWVACGRRGLLFL